MCMSWIILQAQAFPGTLPVCSLVFMSIFPQELDPLRNLSMTSLWVASGRIILKGKERGEGRNLCRKASWVLCHPQKPPWHPSICPEVMAVMAGSLLYVTLQDQMPVD